MASKMMLTCSSSPLVLNKGSSTPSQFGFGPRSVVFRALKPSKTPSLVVRAQTEEDGVSKELSNVDEPLIMRKELSTVDPSLLLHLNKSVAMINASPYIRTPWSATEDENLIKMWFDMPGLPAADINVTIVENLLKIRGNEVIDDGFGRKIQRPFDCKLQLPFNCAKGETKAMLKNGVLFITIPKISSPQNVLPINVPVTPI